MVSLVPGTKVIGVGFICQGVHGQGKSQGKKYFFKVRELSGNFEICQGILEFKQKSGKSQGILK